MSDVVDGMKNFAAKTEGKIALLFLVFLIIFVIVYVILRFTTNKMSTTYIQALPYPLKRGRLTVSEASFPDLKNGLSFSYSWWMFVNDIKLTNQYKLIMERGDRTNKNLFVYMDKVENKMYIKVRTKVADVHNYQFPEPSGIHDARAKLDANNGVFACSTSNAQTATTATDVDFKTFHEDNCLFHTITIDYVPLQTWVNYVLTIDNNYITLYKDGDIYEVTEITNPLKNNNPCADTFCAKNKWHATVDKGESQKPNKAFNLGSGLKRVASPARGEFYISANNADGAGGSNAIMDGVISRLSFFNYSLDNDQVKKTYNAGPMNEGVLGRIGMPLYGVRNPVYRVDEIPQE
jgi:hypothetical protein